MRRFSTSHLLITLGFILAIVVASLYGGLLSPSKKTVQSIAQTSNVVEPTLMRLRLDVKEYLITHDKKYILDFGQESKRFLALLDTLESASKDATIAQNIKELRTDMQNFDTLFKKIVVLEEENVKIESTVFNEYNAALEEHPNRILFQSFTDNDPMSGNSAAHLLDASLKYKLAVASYSLSNNQFFLIRSNELKEEIQKHANKIELLVENKESLKRIKSFKEAFSVYNQGFEHMSKNIQAKQVTMSSAFEEVVPRMINHTQVLVFTLEKES
jgi:hypothetical protein